MEFASRGARLLALAAALAIGAPACRARKPPAPRAAATFALVGAVRDQSGRGVPGARVLVLDQGEAGVAGAAAAGPRHTRSSDAGAFRIENLPRGTYALVVEALGLGVVEPAPVEVPGPPVEIRLPAAVRWIDGQVLDAGRPATGARVLLGGEGARVPREALSDGHNGHFSFAVLEADGYVLRASRGARVSPTLTASQGAPGGFVLTLGPGVFVAGQVVDDDGRGVGGVEVRAETRADDPLPEVATTKPDGGFRLGPLPPGRVRVVASAPAYVLREPASLELSATGVAPPPQRLVLVRGASLAGRIVDARGAPVAGAEIRCVGAGARGDLGDLAVLNGVLPLAAEAAALPGAAGRAVGTTKTARSDARGAFRIQDLVPGPMRLEVARPPFAPLGVDLGPVGPGAAKDVGALILRDAAAVAGRVLDDRGAPVAGARVAVSPQVGVFAETDAGGRFTLALPPGAYTLTASAAGFAAQELPISVTGGDAPPPFEIRLVSGGGALEGLALDSGHRPLARARVRAFVQDARGASPVASTTTDAGGHFKLAHLPARALWVEVDHPSYPVTGALATPGTPLALTAPIPGGVDGEVREHVTGAAVPRARIEAAGPDDQKALGVAGKAAGGAFRLPRLRPGRWTLTVSAAGYQPTTRELDVPASAILGEASLRGVRIELDAVR